MSPAARLAAFLLAALGLPGAATASIRIADSPQRPALRVDAGGNAEASWVSGGVRRTLLIPPRGLVLPGGQLGGPDVSRPASPSSLRLPVTRVLRRTPDRRLWALQTWSTRPDGPLELRFARWRGAPTALQLGLTCCKAGSQVLQGKASFQGRPVTGISPSPEGKALREYAYVDCFACPGGPGWTRISGPATRANGSFSLFLRPAWLGERYRATIPGPNRGWTLAPDARAIVTREPS